MGQWAERRRTSGQIGTATYLSHGACIFHLFVQHVDIVFKSMLLRLLQLEVKLLELLLMLELGFGIGPICVELVLLVVQFLFP